MNENRRIEIDKQIESLTGEFHDNAFNGDGNFAAFYMSCDIRKNDFRASLEANRETFKRLIVSLMEMDSAVAEDIKDAVGYFSQLDMNKKLSFEEWYDINEKEIIIQLAESGADRELDFNIEKEFKERYEKYLNKL